MISLKGEMDKIAVAPVISAPLFDEMRAFAQSLKEALLARGAIIPEAFIDGHYYTRKKHDTGILFYKENADTGDVVLKMFIPEQYSHEVRTMNGNLFIGAGHTMSVTLNGTGKGTSEMSITHNELMNYRPVRLDGPCAHAARINSLMNPSRDLALRPWSEAAKAEVTDYFSRWMDKALQQKGPDPRLAASAQTYIPTGL